jgi:hypothetical protein
MRCTNARAQDPSPDYYFGSASMTVSGDPSSPCNFNGTAVPCPDYIWFSTVIKLQATNLAPVTIFLRNQHITFTANSINYNLPVANSATTFDPSATTATTNYGGTWSTVVPSGASGNQFAAGLPWAVPCPGGLPQSVTVTWTADFYADKPNASVNWTWSAAAYTSFNSDPSTLGVKASDDNHFAPYANSDHAGTPENYKGSVTGGATGGGGSNYTGSLCSTVNVPSPTGARSSTWGVIKVLYR